MNLIDQLFEEFLQKTHMTKGQKALVAAFKSDLKAELDMACVKWRGVTVPIRLGTLHRGKNPLREVIEKPDTAEAWGPGGSSEEAKPLDLERLEAIRELGGFSFYGFGDMIRVHGKSYKGWVSGKVKPKEGKWGEVMDRAEGVLLDLCWEGPCSKQLAACRLKLRLNKKEFAKELDVPAPTYLRWERGEAIPPIHYMEVARGLAEKS